MDEKIKYDVPKLISLNEVNEDASIGAYIPGNCGTGYSAMCLTGNGA